MPAQQVLERLQVRAPVRPLAPPASGVTRNALPGNHKTHTRRRTASARSERVEPDLELFPVSTQYHPRPGLERGDDALEDLAVMAIQPAQSHCAARMRIDFRGGEPALHEHGLHERVPHDRRRQVEISRRRDLVVHVNRVGACTVSGSEPAAGPMDSLVA